MSLRKVLVIALLVSVGCFWSSGAVYAQTLTQDQLKQLVAPFALFPDALVAQISAASTDPQQILDVEDWLHQNSNLQGQALTDAAQQHGFDPAFVSLVNFPTVIEMMATNVNDYAALGNVFRNDQQSVMSAIQTLRQDAFARGALDSNEYQTVSVQQQGSVQVVVVQPTNPQVVFVPQYQPAQVWTSGPSTGDVIAASMVSFGAGIALGSWLNNNSYPWGWGGWGWGWGGRGMIVHNNVWVVNNRWHSPRNNWRPMPPRWGPPIHSRPPSNWNQRPGWRPPPSGWRPNGPNNRPGAGSRPPTRPPNSGGNRPPGGNAGGNRPGGPPGGNNSGGNRPPGNTGGNRPGGNAGGNPGGNAGNRPGGNTPGNPGGNRPGGNTGNRPGGNPGGNTPGNPGGGRPGGNPGGNAGGSRPPGNTGAGRPPTNNTRPARNPYAGFPQQGGGNRPQAQQRPQGQPQARPQPQPQQRPQSRPQTTGARPGGFGGNNNAGATRAASNRGRASAGGGGGNRGGRS